MAWPSLTYTELILYIPCLLLFFYYLYNIYLVFRLSPNWPLVGMLPSLLANSDRVHDWLAEILQLENGNFYLRGPWFPGMKLFVTADPADVHHILTQNFQNYPKGDEFVEIFEALGHGVFNSDGQLWRFQREKLQLTTSQKCFCTFIGKTTQEKIENSLLPFLSETVERSLVIDLQDMFSRLSFDMTCILAFGTDLGSLSTDFPAVPFAQAVDDATATIFFRISRPSAWWKLLKFLQFGQEKRTAKSRVVGERFIAEVIEKRKREMIEGRHACPDLLGSYLCDENIPNSNKFLRDSVVNFLVAGRDTNSSGLSWFFWALSQNQKTEEKILHELSSVHHSTTLEGMAIFDQEELENLVYFKAALLETLRLFPPVPFNFKSVLKPDILPSGSGVTPDMKIIPSAYAMGRMETIWGKDCMEFKPERWISESGTLRHVPSHKFLAFNAGPRTCLGKSMALTQMKMVAAAMVYNFCFQVVEGQVVAPALSIVLHMKNGLMVRVRRRTSI
ncbi:hypothetical protein LUZ62_026308 [Rhynchospora pubera]|uniref:Cytochrome P450 n=1 Tax=Rhynchospora pubera TaxID=906938 RepID=A0AAV8H845_9POAL|nr:hypothetical protein LUZ62_026308 [Rhynchospora pubera]